MAVEVLGISNITTGGRLWMEPQHIRGEIYMVSPTSKLRKYSEGLGVNGIIEANGYSFKKAYSLSKKSRKAGPQVCY